MKNESHLSLPVSLSEVSLLIFFVQFLLEKKVTYVSAVL